MSPNVVDITTLCGASLGFSMTFPLTPRPSNKIATMGHNIVLHNDPDRVESNRIDKRQGNNEDHHEVVEASASARAIAITC